MSRSEILAELVKCLKHAQSALEYCECDPDGFWLESLSTWTRLSASWASLLD